jgi:hypothetical protein
MPTPSIQKIAFWLRHDAGMKCARCRKRVPRRGMLCCSDDCFDKYMATSY